MQDIETHKRSDEWLFTVAEVMDRLRIGRTGIYALINSGELRAVKIGKKRRVFSRDLDAYMASLVSPTD
jgi:excisionase family DNA binding protein